MPENDDRQHAKFSEGVADVLATVSDRLSSHRVTTARELLANDEPNEALLQLAWGIAEDGVAVHRSVLTFIEATVGDPMDLPVDLSGTIRPVVSRRTAR